MNIREETLRALEKNRGKPVSGESLAKSLNVSRTAIWKAVSDLKRAGYPITSGTNRGYALSDESRILSAQGLSPWFSRVAPPLSIHRTIDSTNNEAKRIIAEASAGGIPFGLVIAADEQTAGRGRRGRTFCSPAADSIYLSFILKPASNMERSLLTTIAAATAVCETIECVCEDAPPRIKWVNDIFMDGKKVCGILTEAISDIESGGIEALVLGVGVNINVPETAFPKEIRRVAGSIRLPARDRNRFAAVLIERTLAVCGDLSDSKPLMEHYRRRSMIVGKPIHVIRGAQKENAIALAIGDDGSLAVEYANGERGILHSGEVSILNAE
ncbi:MAG: biotin--[acetyl-CoA-carboxylase] ligase [Clostridiales Family XIII bacterium]|jgi:BirA family biotin operon repressor/biotin-[acetyl-CoA-carboxylase] ligase|nr:biotin--[acetyl-CoA-carboxylase] ligase [Clostridiales Family XIII bacterium]